MSTQHHLVVNDDASLRDQMATYVSDLWINHNNERLTWLGMVDETRRYLNAASTADTEVGQLPWKNKTTIPKLTQIRDMLKGYYKAALMPNDDWMQFEGSTPEAELKGKAIQDYMKSKLRVNGFSYMLDRLLLDWIDTGSCWAGATWKHERIKDLATGLDVDGYIGPVAYRVSPLDCIMNERAETFKDSFFVRKHVKSIHEVMKDEKEYNSAAVAKVKELRSGVEKDILDFYRDAMIQMDGFGNINEYIDSGMVEILEYWGDVYNEKTGTLEVNQRILVADRSFVLSNGPNPSWSGDKPYAHASWRKLPENLYGTGPLHQLIGMQYRCDHLENLKADAFDQIIFPMVKIKGNTVEDYEPGPGIKINCGADGDVVPLPPDVSVLQCDNQVNYYHSQMELMAGSPKEAMGFRTPGEKTAFEVSALQSGADRMFMDKVLSFEENCLEPLLNTMYELIVRNMPVEDIVRVLADDGKTTQLVSFTREDVAARGWLKPVGAKHFAARNKRMKELQGLAQMIPMFPGLPNHVSGLRIGQMLEEELGMEKWNPIEKNVGVREQTESQMLAQQMAQAGQAINEEPPVI